MGERRWDSESERERESERAIEGGRERVCERERRVVGVEVESGGE